MSELVLLLPATHSAVHLWIGCAERTSGEPAVWFEEPEYIHVGLAGPVEAWCGEFLTQVPWFAPKRYPCPTDPDASYVLAPFPTLLPERYVKLHFATSPDAFHFKLRWL